MDRTTDGLATTDSYFPHHLPLLLLSLISILSSIRPLSTLCVEAGSEVTVWASVMADTTDRSFNCHFTQRITHSHAHTQAQIYATVTREGHGYFISYASRGRQCSGWIQNKFFYLIRNAPHTHRQNPCYSAVNYWGEGSGWRYRRIVVRWEV